MTQSITLSIALFSLIGLGSVIIAAKERRTNESFKWFAVIGAGNFIWGLFYVLFYTININDPAVSDRIDTMLFNMSLPAVELSAIGLCLLMMGVTKHKSMSRNNIILLFLMPVLSVIFVLLTDILPIIEISSYTVIISGEKTLHAVHGFWWYFHFIFCIVLMLISLVTSCRMYKRLQKLYRLPVILMICSIVAITVFTLLIAFNLIPYQFRMPSVIANIAQLILFYSVFRTKSMSVGFTSHDIIFDNIENSIFVLDDGRITDFNRAALELVRHIGIDTPFGMKLETLREKISAELNGREFEDDRSIITVNIGTTDVHLQWSEHDIISHNDKKIGCYAEVKNVTPIMSMIHKLQDTAYFDYLTGLYNRHYFAQAEILMSEPSFMPVGVISADINNMKGVNDVYGHAVGDLLLQTVAKHLLMSTRQDAIWARTGGDEFVALVPNTTAEEMDEAVRLIKSESTLRENPKFDSAGLAAAYCLRTDTSKTISQLVSEADAVMYTDKNLDRRRTRT
ncbi:hypothetical protein FACS1894105_03480 [Clostridia bacterium]|nr:hypothetical protein FACS1894105_03480 [Clostridia bacterium]